MQGKLTRLRAVMEQDSESYFKWINDKELVLHNANFVPISKPEHDTWFKNAMLATDTLIFSITENSGNCLIGSCSLRQINQQHRNAELQIRIGETEYHGRGFGSDAIQLLVRYGFEELALMRIYVHVFSHNTRAVRAYEKCNFYKEGLLRKAAFIDNNYVDLLVMSVLNDKPHITHGPA